MSLVELPVGVRRADDPVPAPGDHEEHRLLGPQDQPGVGADAVARHDQVDALARADVELASFVDKGLRLVGPDPGRVHHLARPDLDGLAGLEVPDHGPAHPLALTEELHDPGPTGDVRSVGGSCAGQEQGVPGVVDLCVVVLQRTDQRITAKRGSDPQRVAAAQVSMAGQPPRPPRQRAERVVERDPRSDVHPLPDPSAQRVDERHRTHQVRGQALDEQGPLLQRLRDQPEVEHLQVAQATVDQLARPARRSRGEVTCLDQAHLQAAGGRVERTPGTDDPTTDDEHVEVRARHRGERSLTLAG